MRLFIVSIALGGAVACGDNGASVSGDVDGGDPMDAGVDAPPDAPPESLAAMCGGAEPQTLAEWDACFVKRQCEVIVNCSELNLYADVSECIALLDAVNGGRLGFEAFERERSIAAGRAALDEVAFTQCLRELDSRQCGTAGKPPSCGSRFAGTVADVEACLSDAECLSSGASCAPADCGDSCCLGTCEPRPGLDEPCLDLFDCEPGLKCSISSFTCITGDVGTPCPHRVDCDPGAWCDGGVCRPDFGEGEPCSSLLQCGGETTCVAGQCRRVTEPGDACDEFCFGNLYCDLSGAGLGVCRPLPSNGQPCGALLPCLGQTQRCGAGGVCVERSDLGDPCTDGSCLPGLFCSDQLGEANPVCRAPLADGASECNQPAQCQSHICSGDESAPGSCQPSQTSCP